jgi:ATP-grasp domain, R2K clade family 3
MKNILLQTVNTKEVRTVLHAAMLDDELRIIRKNISEVHSAGDNYIPIGSVEFVRRYANSVGLRIPVWNTYPKCLEKYLYRNIELRTKNEIDLSSISGKFIKPKFTKLFNGFIVGDTDAENLNDYESCAHDSMIYVSDAVDFVSEFRYYIHDKTIVGFARYDQNETETVPTPNLEIVQDAVSKMDHHTYTLDFGVLSNSETALVESNDFWSIGLYDKCLTPTTYTDLLVKRWQEIESLNITN